MSDDILAFLSARHPFDTFAPDDLSEIARAVTERRFSSGEAVYRLGETLPGLFLIRTGDVTVTDGSGEGGLISRLGAGNFLGERGLLKEGRAVTEAVATSETVVLVIPAGLFVKLVETNDRVSRFFRRGEAKAPVHRPNDLATMPVSAIMTPSPLTAKPDDSAADAATAMAEAKVSSLCVMNGNALAGIVTIRDLSGRILAKGRSPDTPIREVMTADPRTLPPDAIGTDVLHMMMELGIGHVPIVDAGTLVGIVTQTDLTRKQAVTSGYLVRDIARAPDAAAIAEVTGQIPALLAQLVGSNKRHDVVTRLITDIADAATRRLLALAEAELGPPPVPYLWLACGSQGRREQTGVSDQDNCLMLDDGASDADMRYFEALARIVTHGLNTAGYVFCPGDMMASNPRWCQPVSVWRRYFHGWIASPDTEAQMLASVMFDLRPIGGEFSLFEGLQEETLKAASDNSIFVAHMVSNSLKHRPPLGLFGGLATTRSGDKKSTIDMKHSGVVPIVDLGRLYALGHRIEVANTRARLVAAIERGAVSTSGGRDLLDAYDLIAGQRLDHQAKQISGGEKPDNDLVPGQLSEFDRSHLRDAFVVVRTMQSAAGQGRGVLS